MKKILNILISLVVMLAVFSCINVVNATSLQPEYDSTFNNNKGIFYANGNDIEIKENSSGETVVSWNGGMQVVPDTVTIIGGGKEGTTFEKSNIKMTSGIVHLIYGGGGSLIETSSSNVEKSNVIINGGTVKATVYGGGLIYAKVEESNVTINGGTVSAVVGGGSASAVISEVAYSAGTEAEPQNSKSRVLDANVTINGGNIEGLYSDLGLIFGGGQGYSFVEETSVIINGGEMSNAYITSGGSNGYTKDAEIIINGGNVKVLQTVNRGTVEKSEVKIKSGQIETVYIGGENDPSVNGIINKSEVDIIGGKVINLKKGTSNGTDIIIDKNNYKAIYVEGTVTESQIDEQEIKVEYDIEIIEDVIKIYRGETKEITPNVITTPVGYEYLFEDEEKTWLSEDEQVVIVNNDGQIQGISRGETTVSTRLLEKSDSVTIRVLPSPFVLVLVMFGTMLALIIIAIIVSVYNRG